MGSVTPQSIQWRPVFENEPLQGQPALFIDLPGFGESAASAEFDGSIEALADAVDDLLTTLGIGSIPVFGHSMGGNVAIMLAYRHPDRVSRLVLAEPLLQASQSILAASVARHSAEAYLVRGHAMLQRATRLQAARGDRTASAFLSTLNMADPRMMYAAASSLIRDRVPDFRAILGTLKPNYVILIGERTSRGMSDDDPELASAVIIPEAGHFMIAEAPETTAYAIVDTVWGTAME